MCLSSRLYNTVSGSLQLTWFIQDYIYRYIGISIFTPLHGFNDIQERTLSSEQEAG
jgi:hypothetical protein